MHELQIHIAIQTNIPNRILRGGRLRKNIYHTTPFVKSSKTKLNNVLSKIYIERKKFKKTRNYGHMI